MTPEDQKQAVWRVCQTITGDCHQCPPSEDHHGDECTRGCYLQAVECVNVVETGNPWRKTTGVRAPWTVLGAKAPSPADGPSCPGDLREQIARVIEPDGWEIFDTVAEYQSRPQSEARWSEAWNEMAWDAKRRSDKSLAKADAILALLPHHDHSAPPSPGMPSDPSELQKLVERLRERAERHERLAMTAWQTDDSSGRAVETAYASLLREAADSLSSLTRERDEAERLLRQFAKDLTPPITTADLEWAERAYKEAKGERLSAPFPEDLREKIARVIEHELERDGGDAVEQCADAILALLPHQDRKR